MFSEYITVNNGIQTLSYDRLYLHQRTNFYRELDAFVDEIEVDLSETDASNAERVEAIDNTVNAVFRTTFYDVEVDADTEQLIKDYVSKKLAERYKVQL